MQLFAFDEDGWALAEADRIIVGLEDEIESLLWQVAELENEVVRLQAENDRLTNDVLARLFDARGDDVLAPLFGVPRD